MPSSNGPSWTSQSHGHSQISMGGVSSLSDSLAQSRSHYQSGYLMSASQSNPQHSTLGTGPHGQQRVDPGGPPLVPTKAKMNHSLLRGSSASDFGMESMFASSSRDRQRQAYADEDAPPTNSVNDIPNDIPSHFNSGTTGRFQPRFEAAQPRQPIAPITGTADQPTYIIVFGYPPDKFSVTAAYFRSLSTNASGVTEADPNLEIMNCFRIGYNDMADAMRAVRKNGEILGGSWYIGVKWADAAQAEALIGRPGHRYSNSSGSAGLSSPSPIQPTTASNGMSMSIDSPSAFPAVGTPIRLAPASSAFRSRNTAPSTPQPAQQAQGGWAGSGALTQAGPGTPATNTPSKGVLGQVSDMIFGW